MSQLSLFDNGKLRFFPVLLVWPIWFFTLINNNLWIKVFKFWPITIAMILGSFIAGSTPLGGGVIAFPVSVLVLGFESHESRDASVLVQSVGMNAAAFLLIITKSNLLHKPSIYVNIFSGCIGMLLGLELNESPETTNLIYTVTVFCFGIVYFYTNIIDKKDNNEKIIDSLDNIQIDLTNFTNKDVKVYLLMGLFGLIGGFITASVGSGSDIAVFLFGIYFWNNFYPKQKMSDNIFTASSVVVMGVMSALTVFARALDVRNPIKSEVLEAFGAMSFIVVLGAPIGSLVLTPQNLIYLQYMFYLLSVIQFILFGVLKLKSNITLWIITVIIVSIVLILLLLKEFVFKKKPLKNNKQESSNLHPDPIIIGQAPLPSDSVLQPLKAPSANTSLQQLVPLSTDINNSKNDSSTGNNNIDAKNTQFESTSSMDGSISDNAENIPIIEINDEDEPNIKIENESGKQLNKNGSQTETI